MSLKHNKKKNSCIVYEQLLTLAARLASEKQETEFNYVMALTKKHFAPNTLIGQERKIIESLIESRCENAADIVAEAVVEAAAMDFDALEKEKVKLINEINTSLGNILFKVPIKNYKLYASAQVLLNEARTGYKSTTPEERVKIKNILVENISRKNINEDVVDIDPFTYKILINKFNQKYGPFLNEDQKEILGGWIKYLLNEDQNDWKQLIDTKVEKIQAEIKTALKSKSHRSNEYAGLLKEASEKLNERPEVITEDVVYEIMRYFDLVEDLNDAENDSK